jgi:ATP-dependent protease HslVU (ClpYQ) peptidase subunit
MTCIVGIEDVDGAIVGGDSNLSNSETQTLIGRSRAKVWRTGPYVIGVAGCPRDADIIRWQTELPDVPARDLHRHMVVGVVPALRKALKRAGRLLRASLPSDQGQPGGDGGDAYDADIMVAIRDRVFVIHGDFQVVSLREGYYAIGSGAPVALGALYASKGMKTERRLRLALEAAEAHACGVRRPWKIIETEYT